MEFKLKQAVQMLNMALVKYDDQVKQIRYPNIVIGSFLPIRDLAEKGLIAWQTSELVGSGGLNDGLINAATTSLVTIDVGLMPKQVPIQNWAKVVPYTLIELEQASRVGVAIDTAKLEHLYKNAQATLQLNGFIGHKGNKNIEGLLTNKKVPTEQKTGFKFSTATAEDRRKLIIDFFYHCYDQTGGSYFPDTIAIDSEDYAILGQELMAVTSAGVPVSAISILKQQLSDIAGFEVEIKSIPTKYAQFTASGISLGYGQEGKATKHRMIAYTNQSNSLEYIVAHMPERLNVVEKDVLSLETGYRMAFSSVVFHDMEGVAYLDYAV